MSRSRRVARVGTYFPCTARAQDQVASDDIHQVIQVHCASDLGGLGGGGGAGGGGKGSHDNFEQKVDAVFIDDDATPASPCSAGYESNSTKKNAYTVFEFIPSDSNLSQD